MIDISAKLVLDHEPYLYYGYDPYATTTIEIKEDEDNYCDGRVFEFIYEDKIIDRFSKNELLELSEYIQFILNKGKK